MSTDWREKEREFLVSLKADTGRDLAEWMALISAQRLPHRNDIIDWLRRQGFMFPRASWLERIYHNGGEPIYLEAGAMLAAGKPPVGPAASPAEVFATPAPVAAAAALPAATVRDVPAPPAPRGAPPQPATEAASVAPPAASIPSTSDASAVRPEPSSPTEIAETLAKAKAYRPLAQFTLRAIETALPGLAVAAGPNHLLLARPAAFALLAISGKDIRLALNLPGLPVAPPMEAVKLPVTMARTAGSFTHMIVLTDARQVDAALVALVVAAAAGANT